MDLRTLSLALCLSGALATALGGWHLPSQPRTRRLAFGLILLGLGAMVIGAWLMPDVAAL